MAEVCPFAEWRPLPEATSQPKITPRTCIFHTAVGGLKGTERFFRDSTGVESHLMVGGPWDGPELDGVIWQWMSLDRQADANLDANRFAISIETSDNAPLRPEDIAPWSPKQLASLVRLGNWLADTFNIPRRVCPAWDQAGLGWHAQWGAPSHWTPARGKVCPGPVRIAQLKAVVFPAIFAGQQLQEEDEMTPEQMKELKDHVTVMAEQACRRAVHAIMTGGTGQWANPTRAGWDFYTEQVRASATRPVATRVEAIEGDTDALVERLIPEPPA
jgi:hypothetical protein